MDECAENDCERERAVKLHIAWAADKEVCTAHARVQAQQEGVVAEPLEGADWP